MALVLVNTHLGDDRIYVIAKVLVAVAVYFLTDWVVAQFYRPSAQVTY